VKIPVEVPSKVPVPVHVPEPVPFPVSQPAIGQVPLFIKQQHQNQENPKPEPYNERHYAEIATGTVNIPETNYEIPVQSHDVKYYNIPETYKATVLEDGHITVPVPQTTHQHNIPENHQYIPEYQQENKPEAYYQSVQSAGVGDHGLNIFGAHKEDIYAGLLGRGQLIQGHGTEDQAYSYQRVNSC
jgi:hypothetical protein